MSTGQTSENAHSLAGLYLQDKSLGLAANISIIPALQRVPLDRDPGIMSKAPSGELGILRAAVSLPVTLDSRAEIPECSMREEAYAQHRCRPGLSECTRILLGLPSGHIYLAHFLLL